MRILRKSLAALASASCVQLATAQDLAVDTEAVAAARATFVERMVSTHGFDRAEITATLADAKIDSDVLQAISRPAERIVPWYEYRNIFLTPARIEAGVAFWRDNEGVVEATARRHDVEPELLL